MPSTPRVFSGGSVCHTLLCSNSYCLGGAGAVHPYRCGSHLTRCGICDGHACRLHPRACCAQRCGHCPAGYWTQGSAASELDRCGGSATGTLRSSSDFLDCPPTGN